MFMEYFVFLSQFYIIKLIEGNLIFLININIIKKNQHQVCAIWKACEVAFDVTSKMMFKQYRLVKLAKWSWLGSSFGRKRDVYSGKLFRQLLFEYICLRFQKILMQNSILIKLNKGVPFFSNPCYSSLKYFIITI